MSPLKEPCFFSEEIRIEHFSDELQSTMHSSAQSLAVYLRDGALQKRFGGIVTCMEDYQRLFTGVRDEVAIGEGSVSYLWSASAASSIARTVPHARIIIVLMDPAERAFHQYLKSLSDRNVTHNFHRHLQLALKDEQNRINIYHPFLAFGNYAKQVHRYIEQFPTEQIHLSLYEDLQHDYDTWFRGVLNFLQVDATFVPKTVQIPSTPQFSHFIKYDGIRSLGLILKRIFRPISAVPSLSREDRKTLVDYYRNSILELAVLIDRDLSAWLEI